MRKGKEGNIMNRVSKEMGDSVVGERKKSYRMDNCQVGNGGRGLENHERNDGGRDIVRELEPEEDI